MKYFKICSLLFFLAVLTSCGVRNVETNIVEVVEKEKFHDRNIFYDIEVFKNYEFNNAINNVPKENAYVGILFDKEKYNSIFDISNELGEHAIYMYEIHLSEDLSYVDNVVLQNIANRSLPYFTIKLGNSFENNYNFLQKLMETTSSYNYEIFYELTSNEYLTDDEINLLNDLIINSAKTNILVENIDVDDALDEVNEFNNRWISFNININDETDITYLNNMLHIITNTYCDTPLILKVNVANYDKLNYTHLAKEAVDNINEVYENVILNYPMISSVIYLNNETEQYKYFLNNGSYKILDAYKKNKNDNYYLKNIINSSYFEEGDKFYNKTNITGVVVDGLFYLPEEDIIAHKINYNDENSIELEGLTYFETFYDELSIENKKVFIN